jgi:putative ABC transport system permease protein
MDSLLQDVRFAWRMLLKSPGFALAGILVMALGIGANTAVFSLVDAVLLRPLPFSQPQRLLHARLVESNTDQYGSFGVADFLAWRDNQKSFEHVAAYAGDGGTYSIVTAGGPLRVRGVRVTSAFFDTLGVTAERGRTFQPQDESGGGAPVVVLSHDFWQSHLGGDPEAIGRAITINGVSATVVGVVPAGIRFPSNQPLDAWVVRRFATPEGRPPYFLECFGRLKPGVSPQQARDELTAISQGVEKQFPIGPSRVGRMEPLRDVFTRDVSKVLWILLASVVFVLLIAIVNVANLLLARASAREREIGIRLALGASRLRIIRLVVTESVMLSVMGGALGVLLAVWIQQAFLGLGGVKIPFAYRIGLDWRVLVFTVGISVASGVLFGLAPALHGTSSPLHDILKDAGRGTAGADSQITRRVLVAAEFAFALVLVAGAALMVRSFLRLGDVSPGFNTSHLLTAEITLPSGLYRDEKSVITFWDEYLRRVNALPGVESASVTLSLPPHLLQLTNPFTVEGQGYDRSRPLQLAEEMTVSPGHFHTLGVPIIAGRDFNVSDRTSGIDAVIINKTMADQFFAGRDPVGRRLQTGDPDPTSPWETIIGVVGDVKYSGLDSPRTPQLYKQYSTKGWTSFSYKMYLVVRTKGDPMGLVAPLRSELASLDRNLTLGEVATMEQQMGDSVGMQRFRTVLLSSFAVVALLLSCLGVYAVLAYTVGQRTREFGIRIALGANRGQIVRLVLSQSLLLCGIGMTAGLVAALMLARTLRSLLFGIGPGDPVSFIATLGLLCAVAVLASYIPALRATRVDPMVALRYE